jgi:hypothetical protein
MYALKALAKLLRAKCGFSISEAVYFSAVLNVHDHRGNNGFRSRCEEHRAIRCITVEPQDSQGRPAHFGRVVDDRGVTWYKTTPNHEDPMLELGDKLYIVTGPKGTVSVLDGHETNRLALGMENSWDAWQRLRAS